MAIFSAVIIVTVLSTTIVKKSNEKFEKYIDSTVSAFENNDDTEKRLDELTVQWEKYYRIVSTVSDRTELDRIWAEIRKLPYVLSDTPENFVAELEGIRAETKLIYKRQTILR